MFTPMLEKGVQANLAVNGKVTITDAEGISLADLLCVNTLDKACQATIQDHRGKPTGASESKNVNINLPDLLHSDERLFSFTGVHSLDLLDGLVDCVSDLDMEPATNKKILPLRDRIILTMVKIKLNLSFEALGVLFGICRQTSSNYFKSTCPMLGRVLRVMIPWPDHEFIRSNLPLSFDKFRDTFIILDCAETNVEKCKCLKCRILTWSQYKKNHTVKFNVGIAPSGLVTEISPAFGGRASDKRIVNESGILDKLIYNDAVMVDKGYAIDKECQEVSLLSAENFSTYLLCKKFNCSFLCLLFLREI